MMCSSAALFLSFLLALAVCGCNSLPIKTANITKFQKLSSCGNSSLYAANLPQGTGYESSPFLVHLVGSREEIGYAYGKMLSNEMETAYNDAMDSILNGYGILRSLLETVLDWQWNHHLSKQVPAVYLQELEALGKGAADAGCSFCGAYTTRSLVLANLPSDTKDIEKLLMGRFNETFTVIAKRLAGYKCSMLALWGSRTAAGKLFSARNLDWNKDTGINKHKIVMITVPNDGGFPSASVGFVGTYGPLAGMSAKGLTVHEANLEANWESLDGFPWILRLRYVMEHATDIASAKSIWESTNNTIGFNHMISSGKDATDYVHNGGHSIVALVMETMFGYTAYFHDNDPRESDALFSPADGSSPVHIGFPLQEALWRTNHGYDPVIREHFLWSQAPVSWSMQRYLFIHNAILDYERSKVKIGALQIMNITAIAGDKGHTHPYQCQENTNGTNILSTVFQPQDSIMYVAWERGSGAKWRPAACSSYVRFDLLPWFKAVPPV